MKEKAARFVRLFCFHLGIENLCFSTQWEDIYFGIGGNRFLSRNRESLLFNENRLYGDSARHSEVSISESRIFVSQLRNVHTYGGCLKAEFPSRNRESLFFNQITKTF